MQRRAFDPVMVLKNTNYKTHWIKICVYPIYKGKINFILNCFVSWMRCFERWQCLKNILWWTLTITWLFCSRNYSVSLLNFLFRRKRLLQLLSWPTTAQVKFLPSLWYLQRMLLKQRAYNSPNNTALYIGRLPLDM